VSKDIRNIRVTSGDVPENKIVFIPNCVEIPECLSKNQTGERLQVGSVGRLVYAKDYGTLITAFDLLMKNGTNGDLIFVGDGPERPKLESMVHDLGIARHVTFTGFQGNVNSFLSKFDIFVLSSIREGIPVAMLEAMAMGVPVVATKVGGIPEVIEDNVDGFLVDSQNPKMIADALIRLSKDMSLRKKIGEAGYKKVKRLFSRDVICRQYEQLYIDLLNLK
jgi:glycosyltransferase involved in cell wall biosynthesis